MAVILITAKATTGCPANAENNAKVAFMGTRNLLVNVQGYRQLLMTISSSNPGDDTFDYDIEVSSPGCKTVRMSYVLTKSNKTLNVRLYPK